MEYHKSKTRAPRGRDAVARHPNGTQVRLSGLALVPLTGRDYFNRCFGQFAGAAGLRSIKELTAPGIVEEHLRRYLRANYSANQRAREEKPEQSGSVSEERAEQ